MGQIFSTNMRNACNYNCNVCKKSGKLPNILGRFVVIENNKMKCTGCNHIFTREEFGNICDKQTGGDDK